MKTVIRNNYTPAALDYCNTLVVDEEEGAVYLFDTDGVFTRITSTTLFTNIVSGTILGSTEVGKISANPDGTGSVNGFDDVIEAAKKIDHLDALPNPFPIIINGTSYDGSTQVQLDIETGGKLYDTTGQNTDGAMTQKAASDAISAVSSAVSGLSNVARTGNYNDLSNKIVVTMTTVDPGEGSSLAENHFIGVYN